VSDADIIHADLTAIMEALGISTHARPYSSHEVVQREVLPAINRLRNRLDRVRALCDEVEEDCVGVQAELIWDIRAALDGPG